MASTEGGMDIEEVAHKTPRRSSPSRSIRRPASWPHHGRTVAQALGLTGELAKQVESWSTQLYTAFVAKDMAMLEINPLVVTKQGDAARASTPR